MFTVFVQGIAIKPLVLLLGVKTKEYGERSLLEEVNRKMINHLTAGIDAMAGNGNLSVTFLARFAYCIHIELRNVH